MSLLPNFTEGTVEVDGEAIAFAAGGDGPALLLIHGYPQTRLMWHPIAKRLANDFRLVLMDLPGYGRSAAPDAGPERYAKRRMAADALGLMRALGCERFAVAGHDRGARVAYRLALDWPDAITRLAVLDIVPTGAVWDRWSVNRAMRYFHWTFLAQAAPLPETLIGHDPSFFLRRMMASWTKAGDLSAFDPAALNDYETAFANPARVRAMCDDYRAGATIDWDHDRHSLAAGQKIRTPLLVLWGDAYDAGAGASPLDIWKEYATNPSGDAIDSGHFVVEENPDATLAHLLPFFAA